MAYWISKSGTLASPNNLTTTEWYRVEAQNPYVRNSTSLVLSTTARTIAFTPANAGSLIGGVIQLVQTVTDIDVEINDVVIKLQELVGGTTWTDRATVTYTRSQIMSGTIPAGGWYMPFVFTSPYSVTAVAGIWRLSITSPAVTSRYWSLGTSDGANAMFCVYSSTTGTPTSGADFLYIKDYVNITANWKFKAVTATGYTTTGYSGVICRNIDPTIANVAYLRIPNPASPITITTDGLCQVSTHGGVQFGTPADPIGADKVNIWLATNAIGTGIQGGFSGPAGQSRTGQTESRWSVFHYGVAPAKKYALATSICAVTGTAIDVDDPTVFAVNDYISIGERITRGNTDTGYARYKVTNITGNTLTFTAGLQQSANVVGAVVTKWQNQATRNTGYGINIRRTETAGLATYQYLAPIGTLNNMIFKGVFTQNVNINGSNNMGTPDISANSSEYLFEDCVFNNNFLEDSLTSRYFAFLQGYSAPFYGIKFKNCIASAISTFTTLPVVGTTTTGASTVTTWYAGTYTLENCRLGHLPTNGQFNTSGVSTIKYFWDGLSVDSAGTGQSGILLTGYSSSFKNITVKGSNCDTATGLFGGIQVNNLYNSVIENYTCDNSNISMQFGGVSIGNVFRNTNFGVTTANLTDIKANYGALVEAKFIGVNGNPIISTNVNTFADGTLIGFQDVNATNVDFSVTPYGDIYRTGAGLSDTTVRTSGGYGIKFVSKSGVYSTTWTQLIPTGNIQNKSAMIGIWCNIANSAYWAGTHQMPRITVNYDNGTTAYAETAQVTGWQFVFVPFTPTTTYGQISVTVSTRTDASLANAPVYFDDISMLYPAGVQLNLGAVDLWADGLPIVPSIATNLSAKDVWAVDPTQFGASTVGDKVNKIKKDTGLIPALL